MKQIMDKLFIGNWDSSQNLHLSIESVLNLRRTNYKPSEYVKAYLNLPWLYIDDPNHMNKLDQAVNFVIEQHEKLQRNTLIHCLVGVDRTIGVTLCYLIYKGMTFENARNHMNGLNLDLPRDCVPEVLCAVQEFEKRLKAMRECI